MCQIKQEPDPILRETAKEIAIDKIPSKKIQDAILCMKTALGREFDGVAIAAPQVGLGLRIFVVAGMVFDIKKKNKGGTPSPDRVFINPKITKRSKEAKWIEGEGCLSVRWMYGTAKRNQRVTVLAHDENGKPFSMGAAGLLAQIFQHEIDHLDGVLFIDHAKDVKRMTDEEIAEHKAEAKRLGK